QTAPAVLPLSIGDGELCSSALTTVSVPEMFRYWLQGGLVLWGVGVAGAFLTALYTCRMVCLTFFGDSTPHVDGPTPAVMSVPLVLLAVAATVAGWLEVP